MMLGVSIKDRILQGTPVSSSRHWLSLPSLAKASIEETLVFPQIEGGGHWDPVSWLEE